MKLVELKRNLRELVDFIPVLNEVFNTKFDSLNWSSHDGLITAKAFLGDEEFSLIIEVQNIKLDKELTWLNVAFARIVDGVPTQALIGSDEQQSKALGAVINALGAKIAELDENYQIDALVFAAASNELKRLLLYRRILDSQVYGLNPAGWRTLSSEIETPGGQALVAVKERIEKDRLEALKAELAKHEKILISA